MTRYYKAVGFVLVMLLGIYGCAQGPAKTDVTDSAETSAKVKKLEEDYRAAAAARDQFRQKLVYAEDQQAKTQKELEQARADAKARTAERDALQTQYDGFRKNLKDLLGSADAAVNSLNLPAKPPTDQGALTGSLGAQAP